MSAFQLAWDYAPPIEGQYWQDLRAAHLPPLPAALADKRSPELLALIRRLTGAQRRGPPHGARPHVRARRRARLPGEGPHSAGGPRRAYAARSAPLLQNKDPLLTQIGLRLRRTGVSMVSGPIAAAAAGGGGGATRGHVLGRSNSYIDTLQGGGTLT